MASRTSTIIAALTFAALAGGVTWAAQQQQAGQFALYRGRPQIRSDVRLVGGNELDIVQYPLRGVTPITQYAQTEGEALHVVLVRDDFRSFSHVHSERNADGMFRVRVALNAGHRYYAFVGSKPLQYPWQVFRFTLQAGAPPHHVVTTFASGSATVAAGPYLVALARTRLSASKPQTVGVRVLTNAGAPVRTVPFRGADAHTVFINAQTLQFVHADAPRANGRVALRIPPLTKGVYRMWLEFDDGKSIFAAPFTLVAE